MNPIVELLGDLAGAERLSDIQEVVERLTTLDGVVAVHWRRHPEPLGRVDQGPHRRIWALPPGELELHVCDAIDGLEALIAGLQAAAGRIVRAAPTLARGRLFDALATRVADGVILATPDGDVQVYNAALERLTGWTHDEVAREGWTNLVYPDIDARRDAQRAIAALTLGRPSDGLVRDLARRDGTPMTAHIWSHLEPVDGRAPIMLGVIRSVAAERTTRVTVPDTGLGDRLAHEVGNLLAAIVGHADLILDATDDAQVEHHAETIAQSALRGGRLAQEVLARSRITSVRTVSTSLGPLVRSVVGLVAVDAPEDVALHVDIAPDLPAAEVDPGAIQQVLLNVLRNALKARGSTRVDVSVAHRSPTGVPRFVADDVAPDLLAIRVRDDGDGFSREALDQLFTPLYSERSDGHGLGLAAVRGILAAHRGAVDVFNAGGAVVDLFVPSTDRPEARLDELQQTTANHGRVVWVVDEHPAVLEFARVSLEGDGFRVHAFPPGPIPADAARPDVVVASPSFRPPSPGAVLIPMVGSPLPEGGPYLVKPFTGRELVTAVRSVRRNGEEG